MLYKLLFLFYIYEKNTQLRVFPIESTWVSDDKQGLDEPMLEYIMIYILKSRVILCGIK